MYNELKVYGNHGIDFSKYEYDELRYFVIMSLRQIPIPDDFFLIAYDFVYKYVNSKKNVDEDFSKIWQLNKWNPVSFPDIPNSPVNDLEEREKIIIAVGPMALFIVFSPEHIILPNFLSERSEFYSPENKEKVQSHRKFFKTIITKFQGDHALYVDERKANKYYIVDLPSFEQTLIEKYGKIKKSLFEYNSSKYPKYYIDNFTDIEI